MSLYTTIQQSSQASRTMGILTLVRHGQASFGAVNYDELTSLGLAQAAHTGTHFAQSNITFDRIISGPLQRQRQTVGAIIGKLPQADEADVVGVLKEFAEPAQILAVAPSTELAPEKRMQHYGATIEAWARGEAVLEGALSSAEFVRRVGDWFDQLRSEPQRGQRTLAVTSAGVIAACMVRHFQLPVGRLGEFAAVINNCSITEFIYSARRCSLLGFNNSSHLAKGWMSKI